mgnify:CR=1 FL=1
MCLKTGRFSGSKSCPLFLNLCRLLVLSGMALAILSCSKKDVYKYEDDVDSEIPYREWGSTKKIVVTTYGSLDFKHQSAALYGDYAFYVSDGRYSFCMYDMREKRKLSTLILTGMDPKVYHCNQSTFGIHKYKSTDPFPLLYVSQRAASDGRCFVEVFRIITSSDDFSSADFSFTVEKVQTIHFPVMSNENSLGNVNAVIDQEKGVLYTYSRNNNSLEETYGRCKVSSFDIPDITIKDVYLEDNDIRSSYMIDYNAFNMQGACIQDDILYIGQGYYSAGYIVLNVVDLNLQKQIRQMNLMKSGVLWEPEGCFFYNGCVMLSETSAIHEMHKKN